MIGNVLRIPEFVINISNIVLVQINKFGEVLFANDKAKCVFNEIGAHKSLKSCLEDKDWFIFDKNIKTVLYNQHSHNFYWDYKNRFYTVSVYPDNASVWMGLEDITEKRQLSHLLYISSQRNVFAEKLSKSGYWELDLSKKRFYWSAGVYKLFEIDDNSLNCQRNLIRELILPQDIPLYKKELKNLLKYKNDIGGFIRIITKSNKIKKCRFGAGIIYENGEEKIAGVFVDMSDCISNSCERCAYLSENFSCMLAKAIHDLRQPLSTMKLLIDNVDEYVSEKGKNSFNKLETVCNNLNSMIEETLNFAKSNDIKNSKFDVKSIIENICDEYFEKADKKGIKLILKLKKYEICQNLFLTEKIIRNIIDNAIKFAKSKIVIKNIKNCFWIIDDGCGFGKNSQNHMDSVTNQCCTVSDKEIKNTGFGLGIVNYCSWLMGAEIKVKSRKGNYSIFKVCL